MIIRRLTNGGVEFKPNLELLKPPQNSVEEFAQRLGYKSFDDMEYKKVFERSIVMHPKLQKFLFDKFYTKH